MDTTVATKTRVAFKNILFATDFSPAAKPPTLCDWPGKAIRSEGSWPARALPGDLSHRWAQKPCHRY